MKKILEHIDYTKPDHKEKMNELFIELLDDAQEYDEDMYNYAKCEIYELAYGKKLNEEMATEWVSKMIPEHEHWTIEETTKAMQDLGYNCDKIDYYVVANMMYNDYHDLVKDDETMALKLAYEWLYDEDAVDDKLYEYWKYIVKRD